MSSKVKLVLGLIAIFVAGLVVGGTVGVTIGKSKTPPAKQEVQRAAAPDRERDHDRGNFTERVCSKLKKELSLTAEQVEQIKPIVDDTSAQVKKLNAENYERVRDIFRASHQKMKPFLTPEQVQKLDDKDRERDERIRKAAGGKPPC